MSGVLLAVITATHSCHVTLAVGNLQKGLASCKQVRLCQIALITIWQAFQFRILLYHWKATNPDAAGLTYLWHCDRIHTLQCEVLEA